MPASYPDATRGVETRETRFSWVFLTDRFAYKLKKPATTRHFDFSTPALRRVECESELRLNARLAPGIYLELLPLVHTLDQRLRLGGEGDVVDWLVKMHRLPAERLLDTAIQAGTLRSTEIESIAERLVAFYGAASPVSLAADDYLSRFADEQAESRQVLCNPAFGFDLTEVGTLLGAVDDVLRVESGLLLVRLTERRIVEGHGDLRPEHIYLGDPPAAIDCLEFSRRLRLLDPFEELAFLGMECAVLGAAWVGQLLIAACMARLSDPVPDRLVDFYAAFRAAMRARQAATHLLDAMPREPQKWHPLARRYIAIGGQYAARLGKCKCSTSRP